MCRRNHLLLLVSVVGALVGGTAAFLATPLNMSDPDIANILCPAEIKGENRDHEWITNEGIRRNIRQFFLTYPPPTNPDLTLPEDASLSELFHLYYGSKASPTRFIKAVNSIAMANVNSDSSQQLRYDSSLHGDGERLSVMQEKLTVRYPQILSSILIEESYSAARSLLGSSLHSIQDFYSHSTWVEQGNTGIYMTLGLPGYSISNPAETEQVCTSCASPQGECYDNVVSGATVTTGYYTYETEMGSDYIVSKPSNGLKCSHGGSLDISSFEAALGGINKDTASPCFSPHYYLSEQAAELAVQATQYYLDNILEAVGFDKYRRLFDLYLGSALSISIDTTGSMGDDIDAVKDQVTQIVENSSPELYVLSQFNDPECGPVFKTTDGKEFLEEVHKLYASGGGDSPELFWCGLQLALAETPDYGDVFCFTDAYAKDGERMDGVISQAQRQSSKVTVILSDLLAKKENSGKTQGGGDIGREPRDLITDISGYERLAEATGGLLISGSKFDVSDIVGIMGGVETSTVTILLREVAGVSSTKFPVDDTVVDFELRLAGELFSGLLYDEAGIRYDIMDDVALAAAGVEVVTFTSNFKALRWTAPTLGEWSLDLAPNEPTTITVLATSSLDFLATFAMLDPTPPHPHYRPTEGQPLMNMVYYVEVTLVGFRESHVAVVSNVQFVNKAGKVLRDIDYPMSVRDQAYLWTDPLPEEAFYVQILGYLASGHPWVRQMPGEVWPVETLVELYSTSDDLEAPPGGSASAKFLVVNYGLESYFDITATDDLGFLVNVNPVRVFLGTNQTTLVTAYFEVPTSATHGQVSTALVTARSATQTLSYNTALAHFFVLPAVADSEPPTCVLDHTPNCTSYANNGLCSTRLWDVTATLQDRDSGLYAVSYVPNGQTVLISDFTPGTVQEVYVFYSTDCCTTELDIRGTDAQGNVGKCPKVDMGPVGGLIYYLEVENAGLTWLAVHWNISESTIPISHYEVVIDGATTHQVPCLESSCYDLISYLQPCTTHQVNVTPIFDYSGEKLIGMGRSTEGTTLEDEPETPVNGREVDATETSITIAWDSANPDCSFEYEVCVYEVSADPATATCEITAEVFLTSGGLAPCHAYFSDVRAFSKSGKASDPLTFYSVTKCTEIPL
ncbi:von Willebrand factor A domain-containing protein 7-like [Eriocheir sinensis]|uniref:von Willebrand factor A domain-containing protein 7-like n=1 Tax=Eriocheir sinensis TaxID=95602 RepID=UPI0021C966EC|nr:von Willebrand factor A domain-containing protein 7-like [Eriocheir sinensis]